MVSLNHNPLDDLLNRFEQRTVTVMCDVHGEQSTIVFKGVVDWNDALCPECERARKNTVRSFERQRAGALAHVKKQRDSMGAIPPRYKGKTLDHYYPETPEAVENHRVLKQYADSFPEMLKNGTSVVLIGQVGTGKTHIAYAMIDHVIRRHHSTAVYATAKRIFDDVKATYKDSSRITESKAIQRYTAPDLLVIDEIGVQHGTVNEQNILSNLMGIRYEAMRPTIIISNLSLPNLKEYAGERVIDRMKERGGITCVFDWESYRVKA